MTPQQIYGAVRLAPFAFSPKLAGVLEAQIAIDMAEDVITEQKAQGLKPGAMPVLPPAAHKDSKLVRRERTLQPILEQLAAHGVMTALAIGNAIDRHVCTVHAACRELRTQGKVAQLSIGANGQVAYTLTAAGPCA